MSSTTAKKSQLLGENHSTAANKLRKAILFQLITLHGYNSCYRCAKLIESVDELSIEHKEPWQSAVDPRTTFYDLNNIAFSHLRCNSSSSAETKRIVAPDGCSWCYRCQQFRPISDFHKSRNRWNGVRNYCVACSSSLKGQWRNRTGRH